MKIDILSKADAESVLPELFEILHSNMSRIAPTGNSYEEDFSFWLSCIKLALNKEPRKILLLRDNDRLAGYFQYYVNDGIFMMEEIQFREPYKGAGLFAELYRYLVETLPADTLFVEAYANKRNEKSIAVLTHLGLEVIGENKNGISFHFRGRYKNLVRRYGTNNGTNNERDLDK